MAGQIINRGKNTWLVRVYMGIDEKGKRKYHNKTIHGTKKEAQAYLYKVLREKDTGDFCEPSKEFLKDYLDRWLETVVRARVRENTYKSYKSVIRLYIIPLLGNTKLSQLTPLKIQNTYNKLIEQGLSPRTVKYTHSLLRDALEQAVKWQMLQQNPTQYVDLPMQHKKEMQAMSREEARRFLNAAINDRWYALFELMITTGLRPSEALALKWQDIDFENGRLYVQRTLIRRDSKGWKLGEPKTSRSKRVVPLPKTVLKSLRKHKKEQAEEKLMAKHYNDYGFVFAGKNGEPLHERNVVRRHFKPILKKAGLPTDIRLYDLRHTCATLLLSAGENPKVISERLGHASVTTTLDTYSHVLPDMQKSATEKLERMLF